MILIPYLNSVGSLILFGGDPGIGKSTLLLQVHYFPICFSLLYAVPMVYINAIF